jgi:hypothetical protein
MYCPTCGVETSQGLNYCKACGASLSGKSDTPARKSLSFKEMLLFLVVASLGLVGPLGLFIESDDLVRTGRAPISVFIVMFGFGALLSFLTLLLLVWLFVRLTSTSSSPWHLLDIRRKDKALPGSQYQIPQIRRGDEATPSVTEHTTRNFEQAVRDE